MPLNRATEIIFDTSGLANSLARLSPDARNRLAEKFKSDFSSLGFQVFLCDPVSASAAGNPDQVFLGFRFFFDGETYSSA
jgi:hypothetical protein